MSLFKSFLLLFSLRSFIPEAVCCRQGLTRLSCAAASLYLFIFLLCLVFFSFLKLFFLPVVYVRTGLPFHRQSGNTKGAQKREVRGNRLCSDTAEVAIDGMLNKKQGNKDCLTHPPCCRQTERQTDFRRLQNEPRPGRECR